MKKAHWITWAIVVAIMFFLGLPDKVEARGYNHFSNVTVEVISDERGPLTKFDAGLNNRHATRSYVIARDNERYTIQISNMSGSRVGAARARSVHNPSVFGQCGVVSTGYQSRT